VREEIGKSCIGDSKVETFKLDREPSAARPIQDSTLESDFGVCPAHRLGDAVGLVQSKISTFESPLQDFPISNSYEKLLGGRLLHQQALKRPFQFTLGVSVSRLRGDGDSGPIGLLRIVPQAEVSV